MNDALGAARTVLVLGGTSELGLACVQALTLRPGATVVLAGRSEVALAAAGESVAGARVVTLAWDARGGADAADAVVAAAVAAVGGDLDIVLAAAGVLGDQAAAEASTAAAVDLLTVNMVGLGAACLAAARRLREQGHGTLVVLSSVAGVRPRRANFVYGASKAGLDALGAGLADALHGSGARVVVVRPGFVVGRMTAGLAPAPFSTTPAAVGAAVADAVRTGKPVVHVPRLLGPLLGVLQHAPRAVWRKLGEKA